MEVMIKVTSIDEAWKKAKEIFPTDFVNDAIASERAGYNIYRHATLNPYCKIADLGNRLEVTTGEYGETTTNIWIVHEEEAAPEPAYGKDLAKQLRETVDISKVTDFERFVLKCGHEFKTKEALQDGYDRCWKAAHGIALSESEFITEAQGSFPDNYDVSTLKEVYTRLVELVDAKKLYPSEIYGYAHYGWCLHTPDAIMAYQGERDRWYVNNCETKISEETARIEVCEEWGFEASRVHIIGTPYYTATDWQFIRFDCAHMTWLWKNGNLYQVYGG